MLQKNEMTSFIGLFHPQITGVLNNGVYRESDMYVVAAIKSDDIYFPGIPCFLILMSL